jgi:hypothetical protein
LNSDFGQSPSQKQKGFKSRSDPVVEEGTGTYVSPVISHTDFLASVQGCLLAKDRDQKTSVPDPDPDPHVFGPTGSRSFYQQAKIVRKPLIPAVSLKNDVNIPSKSNKQKNFFLN